MYRSFVLAPTRKGAVPPVAALVAVLCLWFCLTAIATPFDHDESQYVAGAYFSSRLLIFRDFLYLQPPLHSWTYAPLALAFPHHMVLAMRLATAITALSTLAALWSAQRIAGISRSSAAIATLLVAATAAFQFTGAVVRNDMLPTLLSSIGLLLSLLALRHGSPRYWFAAGVFFGLAIATKLNFAPLGLMTGLFVVSSGARCGFRAACLLAAGALTGIAPMLIVWAIAPDAFYYGVLTFGATAPHAWYAANGAVHELAALEKLADLVKYLWKGPALLALILLAVHWIGTRRRSRSPGRRLVLWMTGGALVGAALPTPSQVQYIMPLLPPLALALGYLLDDARRWPIRRRPALLGLLSIAAIPGMLPATRHVCGMIRDRSPALKADAAAQWMGLTMGALGEGDDIVTLSPHMVLGSGLDLDPRFAAGPFVWRTGWTMAPTLARQVHAMIPATLDDLDRDPPDAILTGYENGTRKLPLRPDDGLIAYARRHGYRMLTMPDGVGRLYLRMRRPSVSRND